MDLASPWIPIWNPARSSTVCKDFNVILGANYDAMLCVLTS
jgi:hypothetical protein